MNIITFSDKVENGGTTPEGKLTASDINQIKDVINSNASDMYESITAQLIGKNLDKDIGRIDYSYENGGVGFQNNTKFPLHPISMCFKLPNSYKEGTDILPKLNWLQQSDNEPNWLIGHKIIKNGLSTGVDDDFLNFNFSKISANRFQYTNGVICQESAFDYINGIDLNIGDLIVVTLFRDNYNNSRLFENRDPSSVKEFASVVSLNFIKDGFGSSSIDAK